MIKVIFHIDLNAFYATCAEIKDPFLKNKPFVVGGSRVGKSGVITTASYSARKYGIHSGMNITDALNLYPSLITIPTDFSLYKKYSNLFIEFLKTYTNLVLKASIDEAYLDVTSLIKDKHALDLAKEIQDTLLSKYGLTSSIGIAPTLFLAKMASDLKKPMGITVIRKKDIVNKLFYLPVSKIHGIGRKTYPSLEFMGIKTIGDFTKKENRENILKIMKENTYESFLDHIMGRSSNVVDPKKYLIPKSISNENTLNFLIDERDLLLPLLDDLIDKTYNRLINEGCVTKTVNIKLRNNMFDTITRSKTLLDYSEDYDELKSNLLELFDLNYNNEPLRLIGVGFSNLILKKDLRVEINLFNYNEFTKREEELFKKTK